MMTSATNSRLETPQSAFLLARAQREGFLRHFGFRESPFGVTPDPEFLFWSQTHNAALQEIVAAVESNLGFSVLLGNPGTGKTTLLFHLLAQYRESARTAFIFQTQCRPHDLIRHIVSELELPVASRDLVFLHQTLNGMLLKEAIAGRKVLIVIDEAQNLQASSLEAIRLLSDFETGSAKLLNVVLSGSQQLGETLRTPELSPLAQRISTISRLEPLSREEVKDYVRFRLAVVAARAAQETFSPDSLVEIALHSAGVPRIINSICYRALILAYIHGQASVTKDFVKQAVRDLDLSELGGGEPWRGLQLPEAGDAPRSNGSSPIFPAGSELWRNAPPQTPVEKVGAAGTVAESFAKTGHVPAGVGSRDINHPKRQPAPAKADQGGRLRAATIIPVRFPGRYRQRSIGLLAALVLLAFGSWLGWKEFGAKPDTDAVSSSLSQPASSRAEVQPSVPPVENEVPQSLVQQPDHPVAPPTNPVRRPSPGIQDPALIDVGPNLLLSSKIQSQTSTPAEPGAPSNVNSISRGANLAPVVTSVRPTLPRLEEPMPDATPKPKATFSLRPIKIVRPEYPAKAKLEHIEGEVEVELTIDRNGNVESVRGLSGNSILLQAAEEAALRWRYSPSTGNQATDPTFTRIRFNFKLNP